MPGYPLPVGPNDHPLNLGRRRHKDLPTIYQTSSHPKRKSSFGRIFYFIQDTTKAGLQKAADLEEALNIPQGSEVEAVSLGFLKLDEDDILFVRAMTSPSTGEEDVALCWVTGGRIFTQAQKDRMVRARDLALGDRDLRSGSAPVKTQGKYLGGTAFERNPRADPVHDSTRCYSIGNSYENHTKLMAPCKDDKILGDEHEEALGMRTALLQAGSSLAMASMREGPEEVLEHISINAELINVPTMGDDSNVCYGGCQLNCACAEPHTSARTLKETMGFFGGKHRDKKDNPAYYTHMCSLSDLPPGYDPGRFFILYPGVFVTLSDFACINFSGLRMHGGSPPRAPLNANPSELQWATRFCLIHYPPNGQTSGQQRYVLGGLPDNTPFTVAPEMTQAIPLSRADRGWCSHAAYLEDGPVVQQRSGHFNFIVRALYCVCLYFILQLPDAYKVKIDLDQFLRAFSMEDENGNRRPADIWTLGPGYRRRQSSPSVGGADSPSAPTPACGSGSSGVIDDSEFVDQEGIRSEMRRKWDKFYNHVAAHIPYAVLKANGVLPLQGPNDPPSEPTPAKSPKGGRPSTAASKKPKARGATDLPKQDERPSKRSRKLSSKQSDESADEATGNRLETDEPSISSLDISGLQGMVQRNDPPSLVPGVRRSARLTKTNDFAIKKNWSTSTDLGDGASVETVLRQSNNTPTFLAAITHDLIRTEYSDVRTSVTAAIASGDNISNQTAVVSLESLIAAFISAPSSCTMLGTISQGWAGLRQLEHQNQRASLLLRKERAVIMMINHRMWYWLDVYIADKVSAILTGGSTSGEDITWLYRLVTEVKSMYNLRITRRTFIATVYGLPLPGTSHDVHLDGRWPRAAEKERSLIVSTVIEILQHWLQFPSHSNARPQAWFIHVILTQFSHHLLYLDFIWTTYTNVFQNVFIRGTWRLTDFTCVQPLIEAAPLHPLFDDHSEHRKMLHDMACLLERYFSGDLTMQRTVEDLPDNDQGFFRSLPAPLQQAANAREMSFVNFLTDAMHFTMSAPGYTFHHPALRSRFIEIPDKTIPYREAAPGRTRFRGMDGPYNPSTIRTTKGIFSAIVWRGITFGTEFSRVGPMLFNSAADFSSVCQSMFPNRPKGFFCDLAAYGAANPLRTVELAQKYWDALADDLWPTFIGHSQVAFLDCYAFFRQRTSDGSKESYLFPQLGPLGSYLLTADLVYAGVVMEPSIDDIAWLIREINRGAAAALEDLGLIPPRTTAQGYTRKPELSTCRKAIQHVHKILVSTIPAELHKSLRIDYITLEHALCKFSRATKKGWLTRDK